MTKPFGFWGKCMAGGAVVALAVAFALPLRAQDQNASESPAPQPVTPDAGLPASVDPLAIAPPKPVAPQTPQTGQAALLFKMQRDPRVTRPGRWLRRFSIDELPQLLNVLKGDMSLVGPRPQVEAEVALYDDSMSRRLHVRPGMTGLWQVSGRNDLSPEEAIRLDLYYVDNWSMLQDLVILFRTVSAVLGSRGAY